LGELRLNTLRIATTTQRHEELKILMPVSLRVFVAFL
jgi:hypothetical protein